MACESILRMLRNFWHSRCRHWPPSSAPSSRPPRLPAAAAAAAAAAILPAATRHQIQIPTRHPVVVAAIAPAHLAHLLPAVRPAGPGGFPAVLSPPAALPPPAPPPPPAVRPVAEVVVVAAVDLLVVTDAVTTIVQGSPVPAPRIWIGVGTVLTPEGTEGSGVVATEGKEKEVVGTGGETRIDEVEVAAETATRAGSFMKMTAGGGAVATPAGPAREIETGGVKAASVCILRVVVMIASEEGLRIE